MPNENPIAKNSIPTIVNGTKLLFCISSFTDIFLSPHRYVNNLSYCTPLTENLYIVVDLKVSPGLSMVEGKSG